MLKFTYYFPPFENIYETLKNGYTNVNAAKELNRNEGTKAAKETGEDKKHLKVSKRRRLEVVGKNKRFKKETVFCYGDVKLTVTDEYVQEPI